MIEPLPMSEELKQEKKRWKCREGIVTDDGGRGSSY